MAKGFKGKYFSLAAITATVSMVHLQAVAAQVQEVQKTRLHYEMEQEEEDTSTVTLANIIVEADGIRSSELDSTSNYELYTSKDIAASKAIDLIDFLNNYTSINISSSYGNRFTPQLDIHGFGLDNGFENIAIVVDGRRINNIDLLPPLLASIPIQIIDKIEIIKGGGSVVYGDGATAAVIDIKTKPIEGIKYQYFKGEYQTTGLKLIGGMQANNLIADFAVDSYRSKGYRKIVETVPDKRHKATSYNAHISLFPKENLEIGVEALQSTMTNYYANPLTKQQFDSDPTQAGAPSAFTNTTYNLQILKTKSIDYFTSYDITEYLGLYFDYIKTFKTSDYPLSNFASDYAYTQKDAKLRYQKGGTQVVIGIADREGVRKGTANRTSKKNRGYFIALSQKIATHTFTLGARKAHVDYIYNGVGNYLSKSDNGYAYTVGYNYRMNTTTSLFANYNRAYQFPDIDRFFLFDFTTGKYRFNNFIDSMKTNTYTIGINRITSQDKLKVALYLIRVHDEIYYNPATFINTNFDKSSKRGIDVIYKRKFHDNIWGSLNYSYVDAKIDSDPLFADKKMPGVSKHNVTAIIGVQTSKYAFIISHTYRSPAYALGDFSNDFWIKQKPYNSTDINFDYKVDKNVKIFARVTNLFDYKNMVVVKSTFKNNVIYPENAVRRWYIGIEGSF